MKGWEIKKLSQLFDVKSSRRVHQADWKSSGIPFYRAREVVKLAKDGIVENELFISEELYEQFTKEKGAPKTGDIIVSAVGTLGQCYLVKDSDKFYFKDASVLWFENSGKVNSRYIEYAFKADSILAQVMDGSMGATVGTLTISRAKDIEIPLPPLPEQQRIVAILDEAFATIAKAKTNAEQNLKNAKELFESYLQGVFENKVDGWEEKTLGEVCEYDKNSNKRDDLPYVGLEDIQSNTGIFIGPFEPRSMKSLTFYFNNDHVLYGRLRPYLNKVLLPDFEGHCSTEIFPIKPKKSVLDRGFLFRWLIAAETMKKINATWTGATLPRANMNAVLDFKINIPPLKEQNKIVQKLDALSAETKKLEAIYLQKINDLEELKKSILQKAFSGELNLNAVI